MISNIISIFNSSGMTIGEKILYLLFYAFCILFSLIIHECAHGWVALRCGDPTAQMMGRLTLNPAKHLDPIGTLCMLFMRIGWAKPVPVNPRNFRNYRRDYILVSFAGIAVNALIFLISTFFAAVALKNMTAGWIYYLYELLLILGQMNLCLAIFNLIPVPPLDGFKLLDQIVFRGSLNLSNQAQQYIRIGFLIVCVSGLLNGLLSRIMSAVYNTVYMFFIRIL